MDHGLLLNRVKSARTASQASKAEAPLHYKMAIDTITSALPQLRGGDKGQALQTLKQLQEEMDAARDNTQLLKKLQTVIKKGNTTDESAQDPDVWPAPAQATTQQAINRGKQSPAAPAVVGRSSGSEIQLNQTKAADTAINDRGVFVQEIEALISKPSDITWESVVGHPDVKGIIRMALVIQPQYPDYFKGIRRAMSSILFYGPPGNGKTMLAQAAAAETKATFFNVSLSALVSKWRGDSEKLVDALWEMARQRKPSIIFIDEIDVFTTHRGSSGEHEASRRLKGQLLIRMDASLREETGIFIIAATNCPWDMDTAILRRFEEKRYIGLPQKEAIIKILENSLFEVDLSAGLSIDVLAERLSGYSACEINVICRKAALMEVTRIGKDGYVDLSASMLEKPVTMEDFEAALREVKPGTSYATLDRYEKWNQTQQA